jgi:hypothetical protein
MTRTKAKVKDAQCNSMFRTANCKRQTKLRRELQKKTVLPEFNMQNNYSRKKYFGTKCITVNSKGDSDSTSAMLRVVNHMMKRSLQLFPFNLVTVTAVSSPSLKLRNVTSSFL